MRARYFHIFKCEFIKKREKKKICGKLMISCSFFNHEGEKERENYYQSVERKQESENVTLFRILYSDL